MSSYEIDTIIFGVPCTIKYDYQPYEAPERGPEAQYPGCPEEITVTDVLVGGVSVSDWLDAGEIVYWFEEAVGEAMESRQEQWLEDRAESKYEEKEAYDEYYSQRH